MILGNIEGIQDGYYQNEERIQTRRRQSMFNISIGVGLTEITLWPTVTWWDVSVEAYRNI